MPSTTRSGCTNPSGSSSSGSRTVSAGSSARTVPAPTSDGVAVGPQAVGVEAGLVAGDPLAGAVGRGGAPVEGGRQLEDDQRPAGAAMVQVGRQLRGHRGGRRLSPAISGHLDGQPGRRACRSMPRPATRWSGSTDTDHHPAHAGLDRRRRRRSGRRWPGVGAGLEGHVERAARGRRRRPRRAPPPRRGGLSGAPWVAPANPGWSAGAPAGTTTAPTQGRGDTVRRDGRGRGHGLAHAGRRRPGGRTGRASVAGSGSCAGRSRLGRRLAIVCRNGRRPAANQLYRNALQFCGTRWCSVGSPASRRSTWGTTSSTASRHSTAPAGEPGVFRMSARPRVPATARDSRPSGDTRRMASASPGAWRSSTTSVPSGVRSRGPKPVPPVVTISPAKPSASSTSASPTDLAPVGAPPGARPRRSLGRARRSTSPAPPVSSGCRRPRRRTRSAPWPPAVVAVRAGSWSPWCVSVVGSASSASVMVGG